MPITDSGLVDDSDDTEVPPALPVGFVVGRKYRIKRVLGMGGNGAVYEGEHTEVGHRVAIKVAHRKLDDRGDVMMRFRREAKICGSLRHPHIGQVFDVGTLEDGAPYMVMELQEGRSLADVVDETTLPIAAIVDITRQLLAGLGAAHRAGTVHLDIKPDNVMLVRDHGGDVVVKLVDFGISKRLDEPEPEAADGDEAVIIGSPDYMPPEQLRGDAVDVRTDLYATGVLLYEGLTSRTPFDGATTAELVMSIFSDPIPSLTKLRPDCPAELESIVHKALSREPQDRFQSADEMSRALATVRAATRNAPAANLARFSERPARSRAVTAVRRKRTVDARTLQTVRLRPAMAVKPKQRHSPRLVAAAAAAVCAILLAWLVGRRGATNTVVVTPLPDIAQPSAAALPAPALAPPASAAASAPAPLGAPAPPSAPSTRALSAGSARTSTTTAASSSPRASVATTTAAARSTAAHAASSPAHAARVAPAPAPAPPPPAPEPVEEAQDPQLTRTQLRAAVSAFNAGRVSEALSLYRELVKAAPREAAAWRGLAVTANRLGERSEAEHALRRYLQLRPNARDAAQILQRL